MRGPERVALSGRCWTVERSPSRRGKQNARVLRATYVAPSATIGATRLAIGALLGAFAASADSGGIQCSGTIGGRAVRGARVTRNSVHVPTLAHGAGLLDVGSLFTHGGR